MIPGPGCPPTWVPIPVQELRCEDQCCAKHCVPLRVCKALTVHKCQGMTIGDGEVFDKVIIHLSEPGRRQTQPGLELVAFTRVKSPDDYAIGNVEELDRASILKIGRGKSYQSRREFETDFKTLAGRTKQTTKAAVTELDPAEQKTFDGGWEYLLNWYENEVRDVLEQLVQT